MKTKDAEAEELGRWSWDGATQRLTIAPNERGLLKDLAGDWTLQDFSHELEGLSRGKLGQALGKGEGPVTCALRLSNGRRTKMIGAFHGNDRADGFLASDESQLADQDQPGPKLDPYFQPILSIHDARTAGFEALARWRDTDGGMQRYTHFEQDGLATNMLIQSAEMLARWIKQTGRSELFVHVNLTGRDLSAGNIPALIKALISSHNLPPQSIRIELTEQAALRDAKNAVRAAQDIKEAGAGLVLDDFGTGHSSFAWVVDMPADGVKIDPTLTARLGDPRAEVVLEIITMLASRLGMTVTAEGVETRSLSGRLRTLGFDYVQGFAFGRPMCADDTFNYLKAE